MMDRLFPGNMMAGMMKNELSRMEEGVLQDRHKQVIGVAGVGRGSGATFIAMSLAFQLAQMTEGVTFAEGRPHGEESAGPYDLLRVDRAFGRRGFTDCFASGGGRRPGISGSGRMNIYKKVNWAVYGPGKAGDEAVSSAGKEAFDYRQLPGRYIIVDSPPAPQEMDLLVAVADPLPSKIMAGLKTWRHLKEQSMVPVIWVMNKSNSQVSRREIENFLKQRFDFYVPLIPAENFYKAEYNCTQAFCEAGLAEIKRLAEEILLAK